MADRLILDTNIFVAAGFNPHSASAAILQAIREGEVDLVWDTATRRESEKIVTQIPRLAWDSFAGLFRPENRYSGETNPERFSVVEDPDDRKFAALAQATGASLVTNDDHLLSVREQLEISILTPAEYRRRQ